MTGWKEPAQYDRKKGDDGQSERNTIYNNEEVLSITKDKDLFIVETNNRKITVDKVIMATGSKATPKTGSNGFGYNGC